MLETFGKTVFFSQKGTLSGPLAVVFVGHHNSTCNRGYIPSYPFIIYKAISRSHNSTYNCWGTTLYPFSFSETKPLFEQ